MNVPFRKKRKNEMDLPKKMGWLAKLVAELVATNPGQVDGSIRRKYSTTPGGP